ncbi:MAG: hypothetical protein ACO3UU_02455 [Minisyncoccia bacterium]
MQNWLNKNPKFIFPLGLIIFLAIGTLYVYFIVLDNPKAKVTDYASCVEANDGIISMIYPPRCTYEGVTYFEDVSITPDEDSNNNKEGINLDLPTSEKSQIEAWLEKNGYNQYGDNPDTMYAGGTPLFDESKGQYIKLYDYLVNKYPNKPWLEKTSNIIDNANTNPAVQSFTEVQSWKNFEDPNFELQYPDFVNMANQNGYPIKFTNTDGFEFILDVTDKQPNYLAGTCEKKLDIGAESLYLCYNKTITYQEIYQRMLDSFVIR